MKFFSILLALSLFTLISSAQTVKTDAGRQLTDMEVKIAEVQTKLGQGNNILKEQLASKTEQHRDVISLRTQLLELNTILSVLTEEKRGLISKELIRTLPNTDVALLKVIATQNERIIELLERIVKSKN